MIRISHGAIFTNVNERGPSVDDTIPGRGPITRRILRGEEKREINITCRVRLASDARDD